MPKRPFLALTHRSCLRRPCSKLSGNLTAHGTTKPATWDVNAQILSSTDMTGTATTSFTFEDYNIQQPRVSVVLSVVDKITLELDFHFVKRSDE